MSAPREFLRLRLLGVGLVVVAAACSSSGGSSETGPTTTASTVPASNPLAETTSTLPGAADRVVLRGDATLDGAPFDAQWVGAVVVRDGLVTPCQSALPPVTNGRYHVTVYAEAESSGCGAPGAQVVLWTYAKDKIVFATAGTPWPGNGRSATFVARYSSSAPAGAAPTTAAFTGRALRADGSALPSGTRVDAYVGTTHCGTASVRSTPDFFGYILGVVGPDSIPGCTRGAALSFKIDGRPATGDQVVNSPPGRQEPLDLTLAS